MILIIIVIKIIITKKIIIKCKNTSRTLTTTNTELLVTLYSGQKLLTNITKSSLSDAAWVLYAPMNTCNGNINKHNCNNSSNNIITRFK